MSLASIFDIAGSGMTAQSIRLNAISSNIANAESVGRTAEDTYKAKLPLFSAIQKKIALDGSIHASNGVQVLDVVDSKDPPLLRYEPNHPFADKNGYVSYPNISVVEQMTDMLSASRSMQSNIDVFDTAKTLMQRMLALGE